MNYPEKVIYKDGETNLQTVVYKDAYGTERAAYSGFLMSEYTTGNITAHYARIGCQYFCANRRTTDAYDTLAAQVLEAL